MSGVAGVDIGGSSIKASLVTPTGRACHVVRAPTPSADLTGERTADAVTDVLQRLHTASGQPLSGAGVALPGIVEASSGTCRRSVNLGWRDVAFGAHLAQRTEVPLTFTHDVRAGALAEARAGAARDVDGLVAFIAVGTGVSLALTRSGLVEPGEPWAGEVGQVVLPLAADGRGAVLESVASASALSRRARRPAEEVSAAAAAGDLAAAALWAELTSGLAQAVAWTTAICSPRCVVVGGGLAEAGEVLLQPLRRELAALVPGLPLPDVRRAGLGDLAGSVGAGLVAHDAAGSLP